MFCKNCGAKLDDDALFCMNCGIKIADASSNKFCSNCGNELEEDAVFCSNCGNRIHDEQFQDEKIHAESNNNNESENIDKTEVPTENEKINESVQENVTTEKKVEENKPYEEPNKTQEENFLSKPQSKIIFIILALAFIVGIVFSVKYTNSNSNSLQTPYKYIPSSDTFDFGSLTPYTFNSTDGLSYEYDCYDLDKKTISNLYENPPRYFIYNGKKYEVDNDNIDLEYDEDYNEYSVTIIWGDYDGSYYHFNGVMIINKNKIMWLWKK